MDSAKLNPRHFIPLDAPVVVCLQTASVSFKSPCLHLVHRPGYSWSLGTCMRGFCSGEARDAQARFWRVGSLARFESCVQNGRLFHVFSVTVQLSVVLTSCLRQRAEMFHCGILSEDGSGVPREGFLDGNALQVWRGRVDLIWI